MCLNGGPKFQPNASISLFYIGDTEEELNKIWNGFTDGGEVLMPLDSYPWAEKYGWVQDKYGVSWQLTLGGFDDVGQRITPCLTFVKDEYGNAEEALNHYTSIFRNSDVDGILRYDENSPGEKAGTVQHAQFAINGYKMMVMDSAQEHNFQFSEGVSLVIECDTQQEIDYYWNKLTEGGAESMCGWLKDKFGVSWQVVPKVLGELMRDPSRAGRVTEAFMKMRKFDIKELEMA